MTDTPDIVGRDLERHITSLEREDARMEAIYRKIDELALGWTQVCYCLDGRWLWEISAEEAGDIDNGTHADEGLARLAMSLACSKALRRHAEAAVDFPDEA